MKIRLLNDLSEFKAYFGFTRDGAILEEDIDLVENPTDWYERKRRDAEALTTVAANVRGRIMDIGTSFGRSAFKFATNSPESRVFTVNLLPEQHANDAELVTHLIPREEIGNYFRKRDVRNVEQIYANTLHWEVPPELNGFEAVFIDAAHDTDAVFSDSMKFWPRVKEGGFLLWHDFTPIHRRQHHWIEAVMRGVERFCDRMGIESEIVNLRESWVGVLRKPAARASVSVSAPARAGRLPEAREPKTGVPEDKGCVIKPFHVPDAMKKLRYLYAYTAHDENRAREEERHIARLRGYGWDVEGFCVAVPFPSPHWGFQQLDAAWKAKHPGLMDMYERLEAKLRAKDVFVLWTGAMIHPDFVSRLSTYNIYVCSDDPDSSENLSRPVAPRFDYSFTRNVACLDLYRSWGVRDVAWLCPPVNPDFNYPDLTGDMILRLPRDLETIMFCERVYGISDRHKRIERLIEAFPKTYVRGKGWPGGFASDAEIVDAYRRARIGWNLHNSTGPTNSRVTALPAFGVLQICDNKSHLGRVFRLDEEVVGFDTIEECIDKTRYYLAHEDERRQIAFRGWRRATQDYSEPRQWERMLAYAAEGAMRKLKLAPDPRPERIVASSSATPSAAPKGPIKLNIGCGREPMPGYLNVDRDPSAAADLFADVRELHRHVEPGTVEETVMVHSLNYLTLWEAREFFRRMYDMTAPGGRLIIETADDERLMDKMRANLGRDLEGYLEGLRAFHGFGLDHLAERRAYAPNAFSWTSWHLGLELKEAGFEDVRALPARTHVAWRDMRIEARKPADATDKPSRRSDWSPMAAPASAGPARTPAQPEAMREAARSAAPKGKVLIIYDSAMGHVTLQTRGLMFRSEYVRRGWDVRYFDYRRTRAEELLAQAAECDVTYTLKVADLALHRAIKERTASRLVFDLTDALWSPIHQQAGWTDLDAIIRTCDALFSENEWICAYGRKFTDQVYSIPVCLQPDKFDAVKATLPPRDPDELVVGYIGSTGTVHSLELVRDALDALARKYRNMRLQILGCTNPAVIPLFRETPFVIIPEYDEETMMREIHGMDVGLFPAPFGIEDFAIRGGQKAFLYMTAGVPAVAHNAGDCGVHIKDGVTGMLVDKPEDWYAKLDVLLGDPGLRKRMGRAASDYIRPLHTMQTVFDVLEAALQSVMARKR